MFNIFCLPKFPIFSFIVNVFSFIFTATIVISSLTSSWNNPNDRVTSELALVNRFFPREGNTCSWLSCVSCDFRLYPGHCECYVVETPSVITDRFVSAGHELNLVPATNCLTCGDRKLKPQFRLLSDSPTPETWAVFIHTICDGPFSGSFQNSHLTLPAPSPCSSGQNGGRVSTGNSDTCTVGQRLFPKFPAFASSLEPVGSLLLVHRCPGLIVVVCRRAGLLETYNSYGKWDRERFQDGARTCQQRPMLLRDQV